MVKNNDETLKDSLKCNFQRQWKLLTLKSKWTQSLNKGANYRWLWFKPHSMPKKRTWKYAKSEIYSYLSNILSCVIIHLTRFWILMYDQFNICLKLPTYKIRKLIKRYYKKRRLQNHWYFHNHKIKMIIFKRSFYSTEYKVSWNDEGISTNCLVLRSATFTQWILSPGEHWHWIDDRRGHAAGVWKVDPFQSQNAKNFPTFFWKKC